MWGTGTTGADNGNVWNIYNYRDRNRDQSFNYDTLNRLISAQNAGTDCTASTVNGKTEYWGNTYGYDPWGNLIDKTITKCGAETFHPGAASVQNQLTGYGYDAAGNMTSDPTDSVSSTYDAENRIATANTPQGAFTYPYDADGYLSIEVLEFFCGDPILQMLGYADLLHGVVADVFGIDFELRHMLVGGRSQSQEAKRAFARACIARSPGPSALMAVYNERFPHSHGERFSHKNDIQANRPRLIRIQHFCIQHGCSGRPAANPCANATLGSTGTARG